MAVLMEGCNCKIHEKMVFSGRLHFLHFYQLYPSTKRAITPMFFEQIEKFQCLESSTTQGLSHGIFRTNVARVTCPETCLKVCQLYDCKNLLKLHTNELKLHSNFLYTYRQSLFS